MLNCKEIFYVKSKSRYLEDGNPKFKYELIGEDLRTEYLFTTEFFLVGTYI